MKIFFTASIFGREKFKENYKAIIAAAEKAGHTVMSKHVMDASTEFPQDSSKSQTTEKYRKILSDLKKAEAVFAETSTSSTSVGYWINQAIQMGKPVVIFHVGDREPRIFTALEETSDKLQIIRYSSVDTVAEEMAYALDFVTSAQDTRFNFFISAELSVYLDWISKHRKIPRSVYLRELLDEDLLKNPQFEQS